MLIGDIVLVQLDPDCWRPLLVTREGLVEVGQRATPTAIQTPTQQAYRVSGLVVCEPEDYHTAGVRGIFQTSHDPARITGQPSRQFPFAYAESLAEGSGIGQWRRRS